MNPSKCRRRAADFERSTQDIVHRAAMAGIKFGREPSPAEMALMRPEQRWDYEHAQHEYSKRSQGMSRNTFDQSNERLAEARGYLAGLRAANTVPGSGYYEACRIRAWYDHDRSALKLTPDGSDVVVPLGWPAGVEKPSEHVAERWDAERAEEGERAEFEHWRASRAKEA